MLGKRIFELFLIEKSWSAHTKRLGAILDFRLCNVEGQILRGCGLFGDYLNFLKNSYRWGGVGYIKIKYLDGSQFEYCYYKGITNFSPSKPTKCK